MKKKKYLKEGRLEDVLALIQVLAIDEMAHRSEEGLKAELPDQPVSADTWTQLAKEHMEFFRVVEGQLPFSVKVSHQSDLSCDAILKYVRKEFADNDTLLPDRATISEKQTDVKWLITDKDEEGTEKRYVVRREKGELNIYTREHPVALIARHVSEEAGKQRPPLTPEHTRALLSTAVELHDRQLRRSQRWYVFIPISVAIITVIGGIVVEIVKD